MKRKKGALKTKQTASAAVASDKVARFLQQNISAVTDMYLLNLAELARYKERHYQQQLLLAQTNEAKLIDALKKAEQQHTELVKAVECCIETKNASFEKDKVPLGAKQCKNCNSITFQQYVICPKCSAVNWWK